MLSQYEADALLAVEKHRVSDERWNYPGPGMEIRIPLISADAREEFLLDVRRHRIVLVHGGKYQTRAKSVWPIARVCFARPHRNPDGAEVPARHLHIYKEGHGLQWAYPLDGRFSKPDDAFRLLIDFMRYSNITREPFIQQDAFA